jgi:hypothetical protein
MTDSNYRQLDESIAPLVRALNSFRGIKTIGSCGGHAAPLQPGQWEEGSWYVKFKVLPNEHGWFAVEFLAWLINTDGKSRNWNFYPVAAPPSLNSPGEMLCFVIEGYDGESPTWFAEHVRESKELLYVSPYKAGFRRGA